MDTVGPDLCVELLDPDGASGWFAVRSGSFVVGLGPAPNPQLRLRGEGVATLTLLSPHVVGHVAAGLLSVQVPGGSWALHPPFDVGAQDSTFPAIPHASLVLQHVCADSPVGHLLFYERFLDGRLVERLGGLAVDPDVTVKHTFSLLVRSFDPELSSLDAVTGMFVDGRERSRILLAAGLYDDRRLRNHLNQRSVENRALVALAAHTTSPRWRQLLSGAR